jgi:hypothetical protein
MRFSASMTPRGGASGRGRSASSSSARSPSVSVLWEERSPPRAGREVISRLSGASLPVPKVPWLAFEFRSTEDDLIGIGVHVDVGALLPARSGFGAARPQEPGITLYPKDR